MTTPVTLASSDVTATLAGMPKMPTKLSGDIKAKAHAIAQDFEAVFLNSMFQHMFTSIDGDGPFGAGAKNGVWRSFLTDEYAKSFAQRGGIGIADQVYRSLIQQQEARQ
ncbi:MAG TPA: flagellar assembly peptidoglycan hydrolase FlgJ [Pseudolabrys sp.]|nr:flagellar assembly peptidoglycan hydrolase FlgJ [Pseudolabrys sp.]